MAAGAILAGANPDEVQACEVYAEKIGLAFQSEYTPSHAIFMTFYVVVVADDILDVISSSEELGKTVGKDESVNKTTYVKLLGLEGSKKEAQRIIQEAKEALAPFGDRAKPLLALADFIVGRNN